MVVTFVLGFCGLDRSFAADRTIKEFKRYAAEKVPAFSRSQIDRLAKAVDADGNGTISDAEFANRMAAFRSYGPMRE